MDLDERKKQLIKLAARCDFLVKYVSLPCFIVSLVLSLYTVGTPNFMFNAFMTLFNGFAALLNMTSRDKILQLVDQLDEVGRRQRVRDLNPNGR